MASGRNVMNVLSPTSYTFKWEMLDDAGRWLTLMEGKGTKVQ